jgi:hypothetical protein
MFESAKAAAAACVLAIAGNAGLAQAQNALMNPSFEDLCAPADAWLTDGNVQSINFYVTSGARALKMWGPFTGGLGYTTAWQDKPATPGQTFLARAFCTNPTWDAFTPTGTRGYIAVDFIDAGGVVLNPFTQISEKVVAPTGDVPVLLETAAYTAPAGTVKVRMTCVIEQENNVGGAGWFDDAYLENTASPGVNILTNSSFESLPPNCFGSAFEGWVNFGNGQGVAQNARTGTYAAKLFGGYNAPVAYSGWFQQLPATPGSRWSASGWGRSWVSDSLQEVNDVFVGIEFWDNQGNNLVGTAARSAGVPTPGDDTYRFYETGIAVAPEGTAFVRCLVLQIQFDFANGATWWDDMTLTRACAADVNGDNQVDFFDYLDFVQLFANDDAAADFNGDNQVDFFDYLDFAAAFDTPC